MSNTAEKFEPSKKIQEQLRAFEDMIEGRPMKPAHFVRLGLDALLDPFRLLLQYMPGGAGFALRRLYYKMVLKQLGANALIDVGVTMTGTENISIGDYTWIDSNCILTAVIGELKIGKRIHIAPGCVIASSCNLEIHDYVGIGAGAKIYSGSETARDGKRMSGPMIPERYKAYTRAPVIIQKDAFVGMNSVVMPGVVIGEGAIVGPNSFVTRDIEPWKMVLGVPAKVVGTRDKVTVPDM